MVLIFISILAVLPLRPTPTFSEAVNVDEGDPVDLTNPIDIGRQALLRQSIPSTRGLWLKDEGVVLYDDPRDEARRREGVINEDKRTKRFWVDNAKDSRRRRIDRKLIDKGPYPPNLVVNDRRERDRIHHSLPINGHQDFSLNLQGPGEDFLNRRIQKEREEEINREVHKAIRAKEKILEDIIIEKRRNLDREKHTPGDIREPLNINPLARQIDRTFASRRGHFDSSLERNEQERRNRLSQIANERRNINTNERITREREINRGEELNRILEEEKLRQIERQREAEILNEKRLGINANTVNKRHFDIPSKPPILIYEKVPVPIHVKVDDSYDNHRFSKPYEERDDDYDDSFLDRRPERPDRIHDNVQAEEEVVIEDISSLLPLVINGANSVLSIDPAIEADFALRANIVAASELEALNVAALADISTLAQLQQAAAIANINHINAINDQVALSQLHDAATLSTTKIFEQAAEVAAVADHATVQTSIVVDDQLAKAQKVDFLNLVFKDGLRNALRGQLRLHLKSKLEEDEFIHDLQVTKEDLIRRLLLLRPYFKSPSQAGFIVPAFIPNIPVGFDTAHEIAALPKIPLLPTTLLAPDFRLPAEIADDLHNKIDIGFVEHILRLPEDIFQNVIHLQKKDFIITLFPTLFRETVDIKYDPVKHYEPNIPHSDIVKEHHHHHFHVHTPPLDKLEHLPHIPPYKDYIPPLDAPIIIQDELDPNVHPAIGGKIQSEIGNPLIHNPPFSTLHDSIKGDPHFHYLSGKLPHDGFHDVNIHPPPINALNHLNGGLKNDYHVHHEPPNTQVIFDDQAINPVEPRREVHIVRHPVHSSISLSIPHASFPHIDHPRLKVPYSGGVSFKPRPKFPFPPRSPLPLEPSSSYIDYNSRENSVFFKNNQGRENSGESSTRSSRPIKSSGEASSPLISPHPVTGISVRHKGEEGHEIISTTTPPSLISTTLIDESFEEREKSIKFPTSHERLQFKQLTSNGFRSAVRLNSKNIGSTIFPFDSNEIGPSTLRPKKIGTSNDDNELSTQSFLPSTIFGSNNPTTTLHPFFSTFKSIDADINVHNDADEEDQAIELLASKESFTSTISPITNTIAPGPPLFKGFSGNVRQKSTSERIHQDQDTQLENSLNWVPGTDINDDSHLASFFQKKTGNATNIHQGIIDDDNRLLADSFQNVHSPESVVDKVKRITNIFGTRLQEGLPTINFRNKNSSINPFFHSNFNTVNDHIKSSSPIISAKHPFHSPDIGQSFQDFEFLKIGTESDKNALRSQIENSNSKVPMPRKIEFNTPLFNTKLHTKRLTNPSQAFTGEHALNGFQNIEGRSHATTSSNTFAGISVEGIETLPSFLREPPLCSTDGNVNKSFCTYPEGYESDKANQMVRANEDEIRELLKIIDELPKQGPNLQEAAKQIPNLNLSVSCEIEKRLIQLSWSRDILGSWLSILQTKPFEQYTTVTTCGDKARKKGCRPLLQPHPFVAFHPKDGTSKPFIMEFPLPVGCVYAESF